MKAIAQKDESDATHRLEIQRLQEQDRRLAQDLARAQEQNATLVEDNRSLASQLVLYQDDAKATSETLVIKDAEVFSFFYDCFWSKTFFPRSLKNSGVRVFFCDHFQMVLNPFDRIVVTNKCAIKRNRLLLSFFARFVS